MKARIGRVLWVALAGSAIAAPGVAQTNEDSHAGIQFNFSTPGARSLGLGGAFLGLADDATAAYANPAGLTNLTLGGPEVSVEIRRWNYSHFFADRGHAGGSPTGIGVDTVAGVQDGKSQNMVSGLSFLSVGYVLPGGATLALYRHELAKFKAEIDTQGPLIGTGGGLFRISPSRSTLDLEVVNYGLATGFELRDDVSLGFGASYYQCHLDSKTERFDRNDRDADGDGDVDARDDQLNRQPGGFFGPPDFLGDNVVDSQLQQGDDDAWGWNVGLLWKVRDSVSLGAVYRKGPAFDVDAAYVYGPRAEAANPTRRSGTRNPNVGGRAVLHIPDVYGIGAAWSKEDSNLKVAFDFDRVLYSRQTEDLTNILQREVGVFDRSNYRIDDANELHAGLEYVFLALETKFVGTVRLGAWYDPAHTLEYHGPDEVLRVRFPARDGELHLSAGVGFVIRENFQVDTALDFSERVNTLSVSVVKFL